MKGSEVRGQPISTLQEARSTDPDRRRNGSEVVVFFFFFK